MHTGDGRIVHQCLSGNTEAFALLVDKYKARIFALVYAKVGQFQDAEDLTQEVFINAYKKLSTLRRWDQFYPWLYSIAVNRCKDFHRDKKRRIDTVPLADPSENHRADMEAHADKLKNEQLHDALATLPEIYRQVLVLRYMAGMKSKEIAQTLRVSPNTINQRLMRAREKLKTVLNEEMIPMMSNAFAEKKLQPGFTARVVELIKATKIQTPPHKTPLPWGLSAVGGLIILLLSLSIPHSPLYPIGEWIGSPLPLRTQVAENGEIPINAKITQVAILADEQVDGDFGQKPKPLQTPAAIGEGEETDEKEITVTGIHLPANYSWDIDISPDGTHLVYTPSRRNESNLTQIVLYPLVTLDASTPTKRRVILEERRETAVYMYPKWSPDGKWIAFYRLGHKIPETEELGKDTGLYLISAAGGEMRFFAQTHIGRYPDGVTTSDGLSWSPDSRQLAFLRWNGKEKRDIYIVALDTGEVRPLTTDGKEKNPEFWSPDGKWFYYSSDQGGWFSPRLRRQPVDGGKAIGIKGFDPVGSGPPIHSPDRKWLAYTGDLPDGKSGFIATRINEQGELAGKPILLKEAKLNASNKALRWTPDGKLIILQEEHRKMIYALNIKNGEQRRVSSDPAFAFEHAQWLSDGKRLFLMSRENQPPGFFDIETGQFTALPIELPEGSRFGQSTLSPDEKWVAFVQTHVKTPQETFPEQFEARAYLYIMPMNEGTSKPVVSSTESFILNPRWSPDGQKITFLNTQFGVSGLKSQLCVVFVSDGQVKTLIDSELCMESAWSPDGTMLAYLQLKPKGNLFDVDKMDGDLYIVPATGGESKRITNTPEKEMEISWIPDGKQLTFKIHGETWVVSIDGGNPQKLERGYIPSSWASDGASWASDETSYLAFEYKTLLSQLKDGGYSGELQRVYLDGVTTPILTLERPVQVQVPPDARPLSMSPDGETILFQQRDVGTLCWRLDVSHLVGQ
jgi:RNA polymerase sigma-70 factor (ECF subfamily)